MFYDTVRIIGLQMTSDVDVQLVKMSSAYDEDVAMLKAKIVRTLICLCTSSMLLKKSDVHLEANISHVKKSMANFTDVMAANKLTKDFEYAASYMQELKDKEYLSFPVQTKHFTI